MQSQCNSIFQMNKPPRPFDLVAFQLHQSTPLLYRPPAMPHTRGRTTGSFYCQTFYSVGIQALSTQLCHPTFYTSTWHMDPCLPASLLASTTVLSVGVYKQVQKVLWTRKLPACLTTLLYAYSKPCLCINIHHYAPTCIVLQQAAAVLVNVQCQVLNR